MINAGQIFKAITSSSMGILIIRSATKHISNSAATIAEKLLTGNTISRRDRIITQAAIEKIFKRDAISAVNPYPVNTIQITGETPSMSNTHMNYLSALLAVG